MTMCKNSQNDYFEFLAHQMKSSFTEDRLCGVRGNNKALYSFDIILSDEEIKEFKELLSYLGN